jgi:hypothetical protein
VKSVDSNLENVGYGQLEHGICHIVLTATHITTCMSADVKECFAGM